MRISYSLRGYLDRVINNPARCVGGTVSSSRLENSGQSTTFNQKREKRKSPKYGDPLKCLSPFQLTRLRTSGIYKFDCNS